MAPYGDIDTAQLELLRHALVEHGKRLAELEDKMDRSIADLYGVREVVRRASARIKRISDRLGVEPDLDDPDQDK